MTTEVTVTLTTDELQAIVDLINWDHGYWGHVDEVEETLRAKCEALLPVKSDA